MQLLMPRYIWTYTGGCI